MEALTLPGVEAGIWQIRNRRDKAAVALADRHYSREIVGAPQVGGPRFLIVLVTPCERAAWISGYDVQEGRGQRSDGLDAYRCDLFRNEGAGLSSDLILEAMRLTIDRWGDPPADGWTTYVDTSKVTSRHPGYCFKMAGWRLDRDWSHRYLIRLRA